MLGLLRLPGHCWGIGAIVLLGGQHAAGLRVIGGGGEVVVEVDMEVVEVDMEVVEVDIEVV